MRTFAQWCESRGVGVGNYQDHELIYNAGLQEGFECGKADLAAMTAAKNRAVEALKQTRKSIGEWLHDEWDGEDGWNAITGRLSQAIAELEEVK